ncbi:choice-of-anchor D domain-containing protein [Flavobacterium terrigena]|uniref:Por secretion system C-terminal sorting domain-containing protein n=1 Tax=Flavobacterium terrigena TaxID=402734 RepID=A0A1H6QMS6_9FLAO|nr:choice-of-anchor D domain-containing protein [Flavobacterium terrigena]SEI40760.1 Por secretion system C-terminal sorting domain-containing protein [Flavobacterium terrigena]
MKLKLLLLSFLLSTALGWGQTSVQNFGTGTGSHTSQTGSTGFIPNPTTSGTSWVRAGATAPNAPISLVTGSNNPLGTTGSCVKAAASSTGSVSKFSPIVGYTGGSAEFYTSFKVMFGDASGGTTATTGTWLFFQGVGSMYSDANSFTNTQLFIGLRFNFSDPGIVNLDYSATGSFVTTGLTTTTLNQGTVYTIEIFGNNKSSGTVNYSYGASAQTVAINKFDLYINGVLVGNDLTKGQIANNSVITATTFIGFNSVNNESNIFVDDVKVYNNIRPFTVTYSNANGSTGTPPTDPNSPYNPTSTVTVLPNGSLVNAGYIFNGWNTAANGSGTAYVAGSIFTPTANTTLYAQWLPTCAPPTQASAVTYSNSTLTGFDASWTAGGGSGTMLVVRENSMANTLPTQNKPIPYTSNLDWASAGQIDLNNRVVFKAAGTSAAPITGLAPGTEYRVTAYEYIASATDCINLAATASTLAYTRSNEPTGHSAAFSCTTSSSSQINLTFSAPNTIGATGYIILQKIGSAPTGLPTDGVSYANGAIIGDATVAGYTTVLGTATSFSAIGLASNTEYYFTLIPFNSFGSVIQTMNYRTSATIPVTNCTTTIAACLVENFSPTGTSTYPSGWIATGTMTSGSTPFVSGPAAIQFTSNTSTLTTSAIANPAQLKFYLQRNSSSNQKTFTVEVSTTSQVAGFTPLVTYNNSTILSPNLYTQYVVDLSAYTNNTVWIRFTKVSAATSVLYMDNMEVYCGMPTSPEMNVTGNAVSIADESTAVSVTDNTDFGATLVGNTIIKTFTIQNTGIDPLYLTGTTPITFSGIHASDFSVTVAPSTPITAVTGTTTFNVTFQPSAGGPRTATLSIANNDTNENAYNFNIQGTGIACTPIGTITSITPTSGPVGTLVTINGTGFTSATNVRFGTVNAIYTVVSSTLITVTVPAGAITADLVIEEAACSSKYSVFTVIEKATSSCDPLTLSVSELFISQVTDASTGALSYIEVYNATASPINLTNYQILIRSDGGASPALDYDIPLIGTIAAGDNFVLAVGTYTTNCSTIGANGSLADQTSTNPYLNKNDCVHLSRLGTVIDTWGVCDGSDWITSLGLGVAGYSFSRKNSATPMPTTTFNATDWDIIDFDSCSDNYSSVGYYSVSHNPPTSTAPVTTLSCADNSGVITVTGAEAVFGGLGLNYQWYANAPGNAGWTTLVNGGVFSGATSNTLNISNLSGLDNYQFYCQVMESSATCYIASTATQFSFSGFSTTWNGSAWNNGAPDSSTAAIINGNYDATINGDIDACSLTVNSAATATITTGHYFNILNNVMVNGVLNIQDSGSLVQINNSGINTGNINMQRTAIVDALDYVYWSSPVNSFSSSNVSPTTTNIIYKWVPTVTSNTNGHGTWINGNETMVQGKGYIERGLNGSAANTPFTATFTGVPNNGEVTIPISRGTYDLAATYDTTVSPTYATKDDDNWNLLGNPYPSSISLYEFLTTNTNIEGFVNIWKHGLAPSQGTQNPFYGTYMYNYSASDYTTYNLSGSSAGSASDYFIGAGQGFFALMNANTAATTENVIFRNNMRDKGYRNDQFFKSTNTNAQASTQNDGRIWLDIVSSTASSRTMLGYINGATNQKDRLFDAIANLKMDMNIYSLVGFEGQVIQGRQLPFDQDDQVNLGVKVPANGNYTVAVGQVDGFFENATQTIYLEDKLLNVIHNLSAAPYQFTANQGTFNDRFVLRYTNQTLGNSDFDAVLNGVVIYTNEAIHVTSSLERIKDVVVYDVLGRIVAEKKAVSGNSVNLTTLRATQSVLIVKVTLENGQIVEKKVIY